MNDLLRELAPISTAAWQAIAEEASRTLKLTLAARKIVDFVGPLGWSAASINLGRIQMPTEAPHVGIQAHLRQALPLTEMRLSFELSRAELETIGRGGKDADLQPVTVAARTIAIAEDRAVFHGYGAGGIEGIFTAAGETLPLTDDYQRYPSVVAEALSKLRQAGIAGPYAIALGPRCYKGLTETTTSGGFRVFEHVERLLDGPVVWAPGIDGAVVVSLRGGDFELIVGQDFVIGYLNHSTTTVQLYLQESFTFRVLTPEAAVPLAYSEAGAAIGRQQP
jgi:uncharacterized linocin/CFP29 family protein